MIALLYLDGYFDRIVQIDYIFYQLFI